MRRFGVELADKFDYLSVGNLPTTRSEGTPLDSPAVVDTVNVEGAVAFVGPGLTASWPEELPRSHVPPECASPGGLASCVTHYLDPPSNQWIDSFLVRFAYTRDAALREIISVV